MCFRWGVTTVRAYIMGYYCFGVTRPISSSCAQCFDSSYSLPSKHAASFSCLFFRSRQIKANQNIVHNMKKSRAMLHRTSIIEMVGGWQDFFVKILDFLIHNLTYAMDSLEVLTYANISGDAANVDVSDVSLHELRPQLGLVQPEVVIEARVGVDVTPRPFVDHDAVFNDLKVCRWMRG